MPPTKTGLNWSATVLNSGPSGIFIINYCILISVLNNEEVSKNATLSGE
jgi:hypothetical protein